MRHVGIFAKGQPSAKEVLESMKRHIDCPVGRARHSQRIGTVEPVFGNLRRNKRLNRFTLRGNKKVEAVPCAQHRGPGRVRPEEIAGTIRALFGARMSARDPIRRVNQPRTTSGGAHTMEIQKTAPMRQPAAGHGGLPQFR